MNTSAMEGRRSALLRMTHQQLINILEGRHGTLAPERADRETLVGLILMAEYGLAAQQPSEAR